jgi:hypothetical protein
MRRTFEVFAFALCIAVFWTVIGILMNIKSSLFLAALFVAMFVLSCLLYPVFIVAGDDDKRAGRDG